MRTRIASIVLLIGLAFSVLALLPRLSGYRLPGNQQGYEPQQPITFSHRLHAGDLKISCVYCHSGADKSRHAGIPSASVCMNCHKSVTASLASMFEAQEKGKKRVVSAELRKLCDHLALDDKLEPIPGKTPRPISWVKAHNLPDFACFDHRPHVQAGVDCKTCHGPVETMERIRQVSDLSMGWCVNCHREVNRTGVHGKKVRASIDCAACHY